MKRFLLLAAGAALLTACETASEIDAIATGASGSSATSSASTSTASSGATSSSSSSTATSSGASSDSTTTYSYDTDPKTALIKIKDPREYYQKLIVHNNLKKYKDYLV